MSKGKVIVRHKVRRNAGFTRWHLTRNKHDKNELVIIFECEDLDKAKPIFSDPALAELMKKAGVLDQPTVFFLEDTETCAL